MESGENVWIRGKRGCREGDSERAVWERGRKKLRCFGASQILEDSLIRELN